MARQQYRQVTRNAQGDAASGVDVEVRDSAGKLATLYSASTGADTLANPMTTGDGTGEKVGAFQFYIDEADYGDFLITVGSGASADTFPVHISARPLPAFPTRAAWYDADISDSVLISSWASDGYTYEVVRDSSGTITQADGTTWSPADKAFPEHWGATTYDTLTDVSTAAGTDDAVSACYNWVKTGKTSTSNGKRGKMCLRAKYYPLAQTFVMDTGDIDIDCPVGAVFYIAHSSGAGVWAQDSEIDFGNLEIRGNAARAATMDKANMGLRIEPATDSADNLIIQFDTSKMVIRFHGGSGIVANSMSGLDVNGTKINNMKRHGVVVCDYGETDRTGTRATGMVTVGGHVRIKDCEGHRLKVGSSASPGGGSAYRIDVENIDGSGCGTNKAILEEDTTDWIRASDTKIDNGGFPTSGMAAAITLAGQNVTFDGANRIVTGGTAPDHGILVREYGSTNETAGVYIGQFQFIGFGPSTAAVDIGAGVDVNTVVIDNTLPINQPLLEDYTNAARVHDGTKMNIKPNTAFGGMLRVPRNGFTAISSGVLDITRVRNAVTGEGGAADDLVTLTVNGATPQDGDTALLTGGSTAQPITIKHGAGNIRCGADIVLSGQPDGVWLIYDATAGYWVLPRGSGVFDGMIVGGSKIEGGQVEIADNAVTTITPAELSGLLIMNMRSRVATPNVAGLSLVAWFDLGSSLAKVEIQQGSLVDTIASGASLTGTTGTDGNMTVSFRSGEIQVENRNGAAREISYVILGM